jgi:hypothetical protein
MYYDRMTMPSELDGVMLELSENGETRSPLVQILAGFNSNPKDIQSKEKLTRRFNEIQFSSWISELTEDSRFGNQKKEFEKVAQNTEIVEFQDKIEEIRKIIRTQLENYPTLLRFIDYTGETLWDPIHVAYGFIPGPNANNKISSDLKLDDEIPYSTKAEDYAKEMQRIYDTDKPLRLYMLKGGKLVRITPSQEMGPWLKGRSFDKNTNKIIILPDVIPPRGQALFTRPIGWVPPSAGGDTPSLYTPYFEDFIIELGSFLEKNDIITVDSSKKTHTDREVNKYLYIIGKDLLGDRRELSDVLSEFENGNLFSLSTIRLDRWYVNMKESLINILEAKKITRLPSKMALILNGFEGSFSKFYEITGLSYENKYKFETRLVLKQLATYFNNIGDPNIKISGDEIGQLTEIIDFSNPSSFYSQMTDQCKPKNRDTIIRHLILAPMKYLAERHDLIGSLNIKGKEIDLRFSSVNDFKLDAGWLRTIDKLASFDITFSLTHSSGGVVSVSLLQEINNYRSKVLSLVLPLINDALRYRDIENYLIEKGYTHTPTRDFTRDVLISIGFGPQVRLASEFLLSSDDEIPRKLRAGTSLRSHTLPSMLFKLNIFDINDFNRLYGTKISKFELALIKNKLRKDITDHFSTTVIGTHTDNVDGDTAQALLSIVYAVSLHDDLHQQAGKQFYGLRGQIDNKLGIPKKSLLVIAKQGQSAPEKLKEIYTKISNWHQNEYGDRSSGLINYDPSDLVSMEKLYAYQDAMVKIIKLGFNFNSPTLKTVKLFEAINSESELIMNAYDTKYWTDHVSHSFLKVYQISKFFGFDPLTFRANPSTSAFDPHHFKAFQFRKMSSHTQDIITTSKIFHGKYEAIKNSMGWRAAEIYVESLVKSLEELINLKDKSGALINIEDKDVRRVLKENFGESEWESVYDGWVSDFTEGMDDIDNYQDALDKINDRRMKYMPGNTQGKTSIDFLLAEYNNLYTNFYQKYLLGNIALSKYVSTERDVDYFNILFRGYTKIKLP